MFYNCISNVNYQNLLTVITPTIFRHPHILLKIIDLLTVIAHLNFESNSVNINENNNDNFST